VSSWPRAFSAGQEAFSTDRGKPAATSAVSEAEAKHSTPPSFSKMGLKDTRTKDTDTDALTLEMANELLEKKRAAPPRKKKKVVRRTKKS
jgi:hypothetical protein